MTVDPALQAEADWLNADSAVTAALSGEQVLPYIRHDPPAGQRVCWLFRTQIDETRDANQLKRITHRLQIRIKWPLETAGANLVQMESAMDDLVRALMTRIRAVGTDKTHGYFSWVAEAQAGIGVPGIQVTYTDAEQAIRQNLPWQADLVYTAVQGSITG